MLGYIRDYDQLRPEYHDGRRWGVHEFQLDGHRTSQLIPRSHVFHEAAATKTAAAFVQTKTTTTNPKGDKMSEEKAPSATPAEATKDPIYFAPNGSGWDSAADAQAEFRQRQLDPNKWSVARSP